MTIICLDTEYDARYSDRGVARLSCMAYSTGPGHAELVNADDAVKLWLSWVADPSIKFLGQSLPNDFAVLADHAHRMHEHRDGVPAFGPWWELAHRLYDDGRVIDTEIRQRLTHVRYGPHKASVGLGDLAKALFGEDLGDSKNIPAEAQACLQAAIPYDEWPEGLLERTPWRVKFGWLVETCGDDVSTWPAAARDYALEDVRLPWRIYEWQRARWGRRIPDERAQTHASWRLHVLAIPGWVADRERAQSIKKLYAAAITQCEDVLIEDEAIHAPGKKITLKRGKVSALVYAALGEDAPMTGAAKALAAADEYVDRRAMTATDAKTVRKAIVSAGGRVLELEDALDRVRAGGTETARVAGFGEWLRGSGAPELNAYLLRCAATSKAKGAEGSEGERDTIAVLCEPVLAAAGIIDITYPRTLKRGRIRDLVYGVLGDEAPLTKTAAETIYDPTPRERYENCSTDAKTVRAAIIQSGAKLYNVVDAVEKANDGKVNLAQWLDDSGQSTLNTYAVWTKATKTVSNFLDPLDSPRRVRTTYVTLVDTGRTASRNLNIQQLPRDYDKPPHMHVRGCITPDPGWAFIIADYSQLELCALAHVLNVLVRWYAKHPKRKAFAEAKLGRSISTNYESTLARAINSGQDCHVLMASVLLNAAYDESQALYKRAEAKKKAKQPLTSDEAKMVETRQLAKPCNFGFPGGLGARKFIDYAAGYGVTIDFATAKRAKKAYEATWIEMKLYFWHVGWTVKKAGGVAVMTQLYSKRERGDCFFTQYCNGGFQPLAADGAKEALGLLIDAAYRQPESPMFGTRPSGFVHDEFLINSRQEQSAQALPEVERLMVQGMRKWIPDVKIEAPGKVLTERWSK